MNKTVLWIILAGIFGILLLAVWQYVFVVYEVKINVEPDELFADNTSICIIKSVPLNSLGKAVPFRSAITDFEIEAGEDLILILEENRDDGLLKIQALDREGEVVIFVKSEYSFLPSKIVISVNKNFT